VVEWVVDEGMRGMRDEERRIVGGALGSSPPLSPCGVVFSSSLFSLVQHTYDDAATDSVGKDELLFPPHPL